MLLRHAEYDVKQRKCYKTDECEIKMETKAFGSFGLSEPVILQAEAGNFWEMESVLYLWTDR